MIKIMILVLVFIFMNGCKKQAHSIDISKYNIKSDKKLRKETL